MRRLLVSVIVLAAMAVGLDRLAVWGASTYLAGRIEAAAHLTQRPDVSVGGFPFLTQVAAGHYDDVTITIADLRTHGLVIDRIRAVGHGVHLPASALVHRSARLVPIDRVDATVRLAYPAIGGSLVGLRTTYAGHGRVRISGSVAGVSESAVVRPSVTASALVIGGHHFDLSGLPFGLRMVAVAASPDGLRIAAEATNVLLPIR